MCMTVWYLSRFWILSFCWSIFLIFFISFMFFSICFKITFWGSVNFPTLPCSVILAVFKAVLASNIFSKLNIVLIWILVYSLFSMIATYPAIRLAICWPSVVWTEKFLFLKSPKSTEKIFSLNTHLFTVVKGNDSLTSLESKSSLKMESLVTPRRSGTNFLLAGSYKREKYMMPFTVGCSLFIKNASNFKHIQSCAWFTVISQKTFELMVGCLGKSTPPTRLFRGKMTK